MNCLHPSSLFLSRCWLSQQGLDHLFGVIVIAFADLEQADVAGFVNEIGCGPIMVAIGAPSGPIVVNGHWPGYSQTLDSILHISNLFFVAEFWAVDANDLKASRLVFGVPFPRRGNRMLAINSAKGPKLHHDHLTAQIRQLERGRVEPSFVEQFGGWPQIAQFSQQSLLCWRWLVGRFWVGWYWGNDRLCVSTLWRRRGQLSTYCHGWGKRRCNGRGGAGQIGRSATGQYTGQYHACCP